MARESEWVGALMLISEDYRGLNRQLHAENPTFGNDNFGWSNYALNVAQNNGYTDILDYGCGKGRLGKLLGENGLTVQEYDPAIEGKEALPQSADFVVCTDVLEHIEPVHINAVLKHLREVTKKRLFLTIFTAPANKNLPDGRNAHILIKDGLWWRKKLLEHFQILLWEERGSVIAAELVAKKHTGMIRPVARRNMSPQMLSYFSSIREQINSASDAFEQIHTIRMWEGLDDEPADLQGACDILQHLDDIDISLSGVAQNAMKCAFVSVKVSDLITEWDWKRIIEKRFRIGQWERTGDHILMVGAPMVSVQGIVAVGAVNPEDRWEQVEAATKRVQGRIEVAPAHERVAILACYGPSLADTIDVLKEEAAKPNVDVVSVSGAHDFLLKHGIVPRYHVECDPRLHKADNIDKPHPDVEYLIASVCHPGYFDKLGDANVKLWHVSTTEHNRRLMDNGENPKHAISGGGSVGLRSIPLLYAMGYRSLHIHAMDCSFKSDGETVMQWAGKHAGKKQDVCDVLCDGVVYISSPILLTYATNFFESIQKVSDLDVRLYGKGLLQAMAQYYQGQDVEFMNRVEQAQPEDESQAA